MAFFPITTSHFDKQFSKLTRKNSVFKAQAAKKIKGIALNPEIGAPKSHKLKGLRSLHKAYRAIDGLIERLIEDEKLLFTLQRMGVSNDEFVRFIRALGL